MFLLYGHGGNTAYTATAALTSATGLTATIGAVPAGSAKSKDIAVSAVTGGAAVRYKRITSSTCNATNYGSGGTLLTLTNNAATVTVTSESDNTKYLCFKVTKANFSAVYVGSGQITGIDDTAPTVARSFATSNSNTAQAKQGDTITVTLDFSEEIDESNTTIKYKVGSGTESTFSYTTGTVTAGKCKETTDSTDIYTCKYTVASGDTGRFKTKVSAFKDVAGNSGTAQSYNSTGITVDTATPSKPTALNLASSDDTGSSNTDNITKNTTGLTITGCAEANSTVELFKDNAAFSTPATDTADGSGCTSPAKRFSINVSLAAQASAYDITAKATDAAGNTSAASTALAITVDTTAPTVTATVSGSNTNRKVKAVDTDTGNTMRYKLIDGSDSCDADEMKSGSISYTEDTDKAVSGSGNNGKKACFSSTDTAGNTGYAATPALAISGGEPVRVWSPTDGSTTNNNSTNITHDFAAAIYADSGCATALTDTTADDRVTLGTTDGGNDIDATVTYNAVSNTITIDPDAVLPDDTYYAGITGSWYYRDGACSQGSASKISFTVDTDAPTFTINIVATDDYINAAEDDSAVSISGTSAGIAVGTSIAVTADGSGTDVNKTGTIGASGVWSVSLTGAQVRALGEGSVTVKVTGTDSGGNTGTQTRAITYDKTAPIAAVDGEPTGTDNATTLAVTVSGTGVTHYKHKVVAGTTCSATGYGSETAVGTNITDSIASLSDGAVVLCVIGRDTAGNWRSSATRARWTKDTAAPTLTVNDVSTDNYINASEDDSSVTISGTSSGLATGATVSVRVDGSGTDVTKTDTTNSSGNWSVSLTSAQVQALGEGSITITVSGSDLGGNSGSATKTITYDKTVPTVAVNDVATDNYINASEDDSSISISGTSSGLTTEATVSVAVDGSGTDVNTTDTTDSDGDWSVTLTSAQVKALGTGSITITVSVEDAAGNNASAAKSITYDKTAPTATMSGQPTGTNNTTTLAVTVAGTGVTHYKHKVVAGTTCSATGYGNETAVGTNITDSISSLSDGSVVVCVLGRDAAGNWQSSATSASWTKDATAPTITVTVSGSNTDRKVKAVDNDSGSTMKYKLIDGSDTCDAAEMGSGSVSYTEDTDKTVSGSGNNGKKACFSSTDGAGNVSYKASAALGVSGGEPVRAWSPTDGSTTNDNTLNITHDFDAAVYTDSGCATALTGTTADDRVTLGTTSGGNDIAVTVTYNATNHTITIDPDNDLADDVYYAGISGSWYYRDGACSQGSASAISFTVDTSAPSFTINTVATDDYINASEDDSSVSISGTSSGLATGATVSIAVDGSGADVNTTDTTDSDGDWSATLTSTQVQALGEGTITITVSGTDTGGNAGSGTKTVVYDTTAPTATTSGQPTGTNNTTTLAVTVAGTGVTHYKHKVVAGTTCSATGYGNETAVGTNITDSISSLSDGSVVLCVLGRDAAGNWQSSATSASWTKDVVAPTITVSVGGTITARTVRGVDDDGGTTTMQYAVIADGTACNASAMSSATSYTEGNDITIALSDNGKKVCFSSEDTAGNTAYSATAALTVAVGLTATIGAIPAGSAQSKDVSISSVTDGVTATYNLITDSSCNATNYGSGGTDLTLVSNAATVTVTDESDNGTYLCLKLTKTNFPTVYIGSAQITGIDDTVPAAPSDIVGPGLLGNDTTPSFTVTVGETGGTVALFSDSSCGVSAGAAAAVLDAVSPYTVSVTIDALSGDGLRTFYAYHTDAAGNVSDCSSVSAFLYLGDRFAGYHHYRWRYCGEQGGFCR